MSELGTKKSDGLSRRDFLKLMGAAGTGLAFAPFVPFGNFMPNPNQASLEKVPVILPDGTQANINTYPINQTGTYTLLTHSTLFGGYSTTEPITLAAKFTHISPEMFDSQESVNVEIKPTPAKSEDISEIITKTEIQNQMNIDTDLPFGTGIAVGIIIGIAIGLVFILIIRQKPPKD